MPLSSPGTCTVTLLALLHKRDKKRKCKAKVRLKGNKGGKCPRCGILQMLEVFCWDGASRISLLPRAEGTEGLQPGTVTPQPLHSPRVAAQPEPWAHPSCLTPIPAGNVLSCPAQPPGGIGRAQEGAELSPAGGFDSKRRSDPSYPPLLCQDLSFRRKELAA